MEILGVSVGNKFKSFYSDSDIYLLNTMYPVLEHFNLLNKLNRAGYTFFLNRLVDYKNLNLSRINSDIVNKVGKWEIALKHFQPIEVIEDIINKKYDRIKKIIPSKIYTTIELTIIGNYGTVGTGAAINKIRTLNDSDYISFNSSKRDVLLITGKKILDNYTRLVKHRNVKSVTKVVLEHYTCADIKVMLDIHSTNILNVSNITYGIDIRPCFISDKIVGGLKEDVDLAILAKNNYTTKSSLTHFNALSPLEKILAYKLLVCYGLKNDNNKNKYIENIKAIHMEKIALIIKDCDKYNTRNLILSIMETNIKNNKFPRLRIKLSDVSAFIYLSNNGKFIQKLREDKYFGVKINPKTDIKDGTISFSLLYKILKAKIALQEKDIK